jgi:glucokinase
MENNKTYVGIDIGGTNTVVGLVDANGKYLANKAFPTHSKEPVTIFMMNIEKEIASLSNQNGNQLCGIGIGVPSANGKTGLLEGAENFNWGPLDIGQMFSDKYRLPVKVLNDADAAALGELKFGAAKNLQNFVYITLGTGLGSSIIIDGKIVHGAKGIAGEFGHTKTYPANRQCACGKRGCLETFVSANGIVRTAFELLSTETTQSVLGDYNFNQLTPKILSEIALKGDAIAIQTFQYTGKILGEKMAELVGLLNPEAIIFSGGLVAAGDLLFDTMKTALEDNLLNMHKNSVQIRLSNPEKNYAVLGAASQLMKENHDTK